LRPGTAIYPTTWGLEDGLVYPTLPVDHTLRFEKVSYPVPVGTVFVVRYLPERPSEIGEVEPHEALLFAMENLLNPGSIGKKGLDLLMEALSKAKTYRSIHSDWKDVLEFYSSRSL